MAFVISPLSAWSIYYTYHIASNIHPIKSLVSNSLFKCKLKCSNARIHFLTTLISKFREVIQNFYKSRNIYPLSLTFRSFCRQILNGELVFFKCMLPLVDAKVGSHHDHIRCVGLDFKYSKPIRCCSANL